MLLNHDRAFADFAPATPLTVQPVQQPALATVAQDTWFETPDGWSPITDLSDGALVRSYDGGFVAITKIDHSPFSQEECITLPEGCLGAATPLTLPADQWVAINHHRLEKFCGSPIALTRADSLPGYRQTVNTQSRKPVSRIACAEEELLYVQTGALVHVPSANPRSAFKKLSYGETRAILMMIDGAGCGPDTVKMPMAYAA